MTNEEVALKLGWTKRKTNIRKEKGGTASQCDTYWGCDEQFTHGNYLPPFTTSLDAIAGEIKRRNLSYQVTNDGSRGWPEAIVFTKTGGTGRWQKDEKDTLALCKALIAYLEAPPRGGQ